MYPNILKLSPADFIVSSGTNRTVYGFGGRPNKQATLERIPIAFAECLKSFDFCPLENTIASMRALCYLFYWLGDIASRLPWFGWDPWSWKFYQFCMNKSLDLDKDCSIWKKVD